MVKKDSFTKLFLHAEKTERNFINRIDELIQRRAAIENVQIRPQTVKLTTDAVASSTFVLSTEEYTHPQSYLDGSYTLWDGSSYTAEDTLVKVVNLNDTFIEKFNHESFINSSLTTGTISSSTQQAVLDVDEIITSEVVYKDTTAYTELQIDVVSDSDTDLTVEYSTNGSTWTEISDGITTSVSSFTALYYRITNTSTDGEGLLPLDLPGALAVPATVTIEKIEVKYS